MSLFRFKCLLVLLVPCAVLLTLSGCAGSARERAYSMNNLKQIGLAMHNYNDVERHLPPQAIKSADGKPLLSWRVAILPYIEQANLYRRFKLDEPWDSAHNKALLAEMPKTYEIPGTSPGLGMTYYQAFAGKRAMFDPTEEKPLTLVDAKDGTANTVLIGEAAKAVPWTKPEDMSFDEAQPLPTLGDHYGSDVCMLLMADGSVRAIRPDSLPDQNLRNAIIRDDGKPLPLE